MEIKCRISSDTFWDFSRFHRFINNRRALNIILFPALLIALAIGNLILKNYIVSLILFALAILQPALILYFFHKETAAQITRFHLDESPKYFYTLTFYSDRIHIKNPSEQIDYRWDQLYRLYRTTQYLYVYPNEMQAFILPKECIGSDDWDNLWSLICQYAPADKIMEKKPQWEKAGQRK